MNISARLSNSRNRNEVVVQTGERSQQLSIPPKMTGYGAGVNGGELLFLALATCYCNDVYREAAKQGIPIEGVDVTVEGRFGADGVPASEIVYRARVNSPAPERQIRALLIQTDAVAEIHNTLRVPTTVTLELERPA